MLKQTISIILIGLVLNLALYPTNAKANTNEEKETKFATKVKTELLKLGTGTEAKVQVKLKDGTKLKGYVSETNQDSFTVVDGKINKNTIPYSQVKQVKGNNLSTSVTITIGVAILVVFMALWAARQG